MVDPIVPATNHPWRWHRHPAFKDHKLTMGERAADIIRDQMGSWTFIFTFIGLMIVWATVNSIFLQRVLQHKPFDPYPYILLNLMLSTLAGLQGGILLIAAKRQDQIASAVAQHTLETEIKNSAKLDAIVAHLQIEIPADTVTVPDKKD